MPRRIVEYQPTPNPNAVKIVTDPPPSGGIRSYFKAEQATDDPLGSALFAVAGVTTVLIHTDFITVNKSPDAEWSEVKPGVQQAIAEHD